MHIYMHYPLVAAISHATLQSDMELRAWLLIIHDHECRLGGMHAHNTPAHAYA